MVLNDVSAASIVPSKPPTCEDHNNISWCWAVDPCGEPFEPIAFILTNLSMGTAQADILDIAMIDNIPDHNFSSIPERIWMLY